MSTTHDSERYVPRWLRAFHATAAAFVYIGGLLPLFWLAAFYCFIVRVRLAAGSWPIVAGGPDRYYFGFGVHDFLVGSGLFILPLSFVSWCVASGGFTLIAPTVVPFRRFIFLFLVWLGVAALVIADPGSFFRWYFLYSD